MYCFSLHYFQIKFTKISTTRLIPYHSILSHNCICGYLIAISDLLGNCSTNIVKIPRHTRDKLLTHRRKSSLHQPAGPGYTSARGGGLCQRADPAAAGHGERRDRTGQGRQQRRPRSCVLCHIPATKENDEGRFPPRYSQQAGS